MRTVRLMRIVSLMVMVPLVTVPACLAGTQTIMTEATYLMGDGESPSFAEAQVLQKAKQAALEQAGTYVEAYTKTRNYDLTTEEIQTLAGGVLAVEVMEKTRALIADGLRFYTKIRAIVTTDRMEELAQRIRGKNVAAEYTKLQEDYARLNKEIESWKELIAKTASGPERDTALSQIREKEKQFSTVQKNEMALFKRLIAGQVLVSEARNTKAEVDQLIENIVSLGQLVSLGKISASVLPRQQGGTHKKPLQPKETWFPWGNWPLSDANNDAKQSSEKIIISVPATVEISPSLRSMLTDAARSLKGKGLLPPPKVYRPELTALGGTYRYPRQLGDRIKVTNLQMLDSGQRFSSSVDQWSFSTLVNGIEFELSDGQHVNQYFREMLERVRLLIHLSLENDQKIECVVPSIVGRVIPVKYFSSNGRGRSGFAWDAERQHEHDAVVLLEEKVTFEIEFVLAPNTAQQVKSVETTFLHDAQITKQSLCQIVLPNDAGRR